MSDVLAAYQKIAASQSLPELTAGGYLCKPETFEDGRSAYDAFCREGCDRGWLQCQSHQDIFRGGPPELASAWGLPIAAEAGNGKDKSVALRFENGQWVLRRFTHSEGDPHSVWDRVEQLIHGSAGKLVYRRYWRRDAEQGYVQAHACLIDVTEE